MDNRNKFGSGMYGNSGNAPRQSFQNGNFSSGNGGFSQQQPPKHNARRFRINTRILKYSAMGLSIAALIFFGIWWKFLYTGLPSQPEYKQTARYTYDLIQSSWQNKDFNTASYKQNVEDAWLPKELDYYNDNKTFEKFMMHILSNTHFKFDTKTMTSRQGDKVKITETGIAAPTVKVVIPDYKKLTAMMQNNDAGAITQVYQQRGTQPTDYHYNDEVLKMYIDYVLSYKNLPTKTVEIPLTTTEVSDAKNAKKAGLPIYKVISDKKLDEALFSSDDFHESQTVFAAIATGSIGTVGDNPEHAAWAVRKKQYDAELAAKDKYNADMKVYNKAVADAKKAKAESSSNSSSSTSSNATSSSQAPAQPAVQLPLKPVKPETPLLTYERSKTELKHDKELILEKSITTDAKLVQDTPIDGAFRVKENPALHITPTVEQTPEQKAADQGKVVYVNGKPVYADGTSANKQSKNKNLIDAMQKLRKQESVIGVEPKAQIPLREQLQNEDYLKWATLDQAVKVATPQPAQTINKPLPEQAVIKFTWTGSDYLLNKYVDEKGKHKVIHPRWGTGSFDKPAAIGTPIDVKMLDDSGNPHDVRITLTKIYTEGKAIDYATDFDVRNRGFDNSATNKLAVIEFEVKNLENQDNTLNTSFTLSDANGNEIPRNGTMYSFMTKAKFKPQQTITMQDWFYTSDINKLYLTWSKNFNKKYPIVWFRVLAAKNAGGPMY